MVTEQGFEKAIKPKLEEFELDENKVKFLIDFKLKCEKKFNRYLWVFFWLLTLFGVVVLFNLSPGANYSVGIFLVLMLPAIISGFIVPEILKRITKSEFKDIMFELTKNETITKLDKNYNSYTLALKIYKTENDIYERGLRRTFWQYWLSLTPTDFELAVGDLFIDKGYEVWTTRATGDQGVDLFLEKDGKKVVVQCKTHKKVLGPNSVRDLYGAMTAQQADEAFLVAPSGFSAATKAFCRDKPIKLFDIDDLTKMTYDFESYSPYWLDNAKSLDDMVKGINKNLLVGGRKLRRY